MRRELKEIFLQKAFHGFSFYKGYCLCFWIFNTCFSSINRGKLCLKPSFCFITIATFGIEIIGNKVKSTFSPKRIWGWHFTKDFRLSILHFQHPALLQIKCSKSPLLYSVMCYHNINPNLSAKFVCCVYVSIAPSTWKKVTRVFWY